MKIPQSVRSTYAEICPTYARLASKVNSLVNNAKHARWHYESRLKSEESYALKLETGREANPRCPEDFFACMVVVENHATVSTARDEILRLFNLEYQRPKTPGQTHLSPDRFSFDDLRLYVSWKDSDSEPPTGLNGVIFEVQIKTFLQHAWGIATHDLLYKTDDVDWGSSRVAFQVRAMLENAELCISEAHSLRGSLMLDRCDQETKSTQDIIVELRARWSEEGALPRDVRRLAQNVGNLSRSLRLDLEFIWKALDEATRNGKGSRTLNLSPYSAILDALVSERGIEVLDNLDRKASVFIPSEIEIPADWKPKGKIVRT